MRPTPKEPSVDRPSCFARPRCVTSRAAAPFARRHIGPDAAEQQTMLADAGLRLRSTTCSYAALPDSIRTDKALDLPPALSEVGARDALLELSRAQQRARSR